MWPQALQMSRDECRGILRRLELESYSHVISVFRAQGGLSENKAKLLEELRGIFHISQERHRAEARRVASDEQLCTIAEAISGPNTWQEWSREGRRSFPMLPRVAPQTALALIANNVASETASENAKLPFPADTAAAYASEQVNSISGREDATPWEIRRDVFVVTDDPFKMPDIPVSNKKNLKRNISDNQSAGSNKKRIVGDSSPIKHQQHQKQFHHITANSAQATSPSSGSSNIRKLYHNHNNKTTNQRANQTQIQKQKLATKKSAAAMNTAGNTVMAVTPSKRQATPAKSGRKPNSKIQEQKQQQQALAQQQQQQLLPQTAVRNIQHVVGEGSDEFNMEQKYAQPQIATSKKDITKNLTKLQLPSVITTPSANASALSPTPISSGNALTASPATRIDVHQLTTALSPPIVGGSSGSTGVPIILHGKVEKQLISTPVQKIILEDRLPPQQSPGLMVTSSTTSTATAVVVSSAPTIQLKSTSTPQIMTLPQISAAATKLRAINTTILPPGTKLTTKKSTLITTSGVNIPGNESGTLSTSGSGTNHTQVFSIIDSAQGTPALPTHTPPAIIQIQNANTNSVSNENAMPSASQTLPTQGKVLTTKLVPKVLGGTSVSVGSATTTLSGSSSGGNTVNITKIETLNNGATLLSSGSNNPNTSLAGTTTTVLKGVGSTILLSPNQSGTTSGGGALFSTLTTGAPVFRKSQIFKTGTIGVSASSAGKLSGTFSTSNSGPQIISNIKLTPAHTTSSITSVTHSNQQQSTTTASPFLQQQLKTGIRASVKICQSSNGKMFIQPANIDSASKTKLQSTLSHKILPNAVVSSSSTGAGTSVSHQPQRIAIQKVQIIPAPLHSPSTITGPFHTVTTQSQAQTKPTNTITLSGNKGNMNMVFMPTVSGRPTSGTITLSKGANVTSGIVATNKVQQTGQNADAAVKPNVVIIGSSASQSGTSTTAKPAASFLDGNNKYSVTSTGRSTANAVHLEANQMITEDTPVDILNMPIIVDSGDGTNITMGNNIGDTVTVLPSALIENTEQQEGQQQQAQEQQQQQPSAIILGATDWEMELDQATAVAAATKAAARTEYHQQSSGKTHKNSMADTQKQQQHQMYDKPTIDGETIILDDSFEDVIVEEQEEGETTDAGTETEGTADDVETGDETGGEEGQEMTERAYTIFSGSESGEVLPTKPQDTAKIRVGRVHKTYNNNKTAINDDEPIEVIDDEDEQQVCGGAGSEKKPVKKADSDSENMEREVNVANVHNERENNMAAVNECETDAGFDETIVADIDENTAIEYIEEENNAHSVNDKSELLHTVRNTPSSTNVKRQIIESDVIVLDDNESEALTAIATLAATASTIVAAEGSADIKETETMKMVSVAATTKSIKVAAGNSNDATGLH